MSDEEGFLKAIADDPLDDTNRQVYADWLLERGDPRGEFLRLHCEINRLRREQEAAQARLTVLTPQMPADWLGAVFVPFRVVLHRYRYDRKITVIKVIRELTQSGLKEAKDMSEALPAVVLRVVGLEAARDAQRRLAEAAGEDGVAIEPGGGVTIEPPLPESLPGPFRVVLHRYRPDKKISTIKAVRQLTGLGLVEAKNLSEALPAVVLREVDLLRAQYAQRLLHDAGAEATVELPPETVPSGR
jgi:uncharacterized protein (TIGR02996 family)